MMDKVITTREREREGLTVRVLFPLDPSLNVIRLMYKENVEELDNSDFFMID